MARGRPKKNAAAIAAFAHNLNTLMQDNGITPKIIADEFGFKYTSQVYFWTTGKCMPTNENLKRLADFLGVKASDLTGQSLIQVLKREGVA